MKKIIMILAIVLTSNSWAGTSSVTPKATATLTSTCAMSATMIDMGDISQLISAQNDSVVQAGSGTVTVYCTKGTSYSIALNLGANTDGVAKLLKDDKGNTISYGICQTTGVDQSKGCVVDWYTGNGYNYIVTGTGNGATQTYPMYGSLRKKYYTPGIYTDTTTATITY